MCGIGGFFRNTNVPLTDNQLEKLRLTVRNIFLEIEARGRDAAGLVLLDDDKNVIDLTKRCIPATEFVKSKAFDKSVMQISGKTQAVLMHTRLGTHGDNTQVNAHPIVQGHVVGTHNGVLQNYQSLAKQFDALKFIKGETDSEHLWAALRAGTGDGAAGSVKVLESMWGSASIVYGLKKDPHLYMFRKNNPNVLYYDPETRTLFWTSMSNMAGAIREGGFHRAGSNPRTFAEDYLLRFDPSKFNEESAVVTKSDRISYDWGRNNRQSYYNTYLSNKVEECEVCKCDIESGDTYSEVRMGKYGTWYDMCDTCVLTHWDILLATDSGIREKVKA